MTLDPISLTPVPPTDSPETPEEFFPSEPSSHEADVADVPHLGHAILFFVMCIPILIVGELLSLYVAVKLHLFGSKNFKAMFDVMSSDARLAIPTQAFIYTLIGLIAIPVFSVLWRRPFSEGIHWNASVVRRRFLWLVGLGLGIGFGIIFLQYYLPMPQNPPILEDMMRSPLGAWLMFVFGVTFAPLIEELAFRGFLLPGLIHAFRWLMSHEILSTEAFSWMTVPVSALIATVPFALLHAAQVSHAWGPLLLISLVSIALCVVRLRWNSLAASAIVHSAYNFTLFFGMLVQTGGFRHLDRLNG